MRENCHKSLLKKSNQVFEIILLSLLHIMLAGYISIYIYRIKRYFLLQLNLKYCTQLKFKPTHGMTKNSIIKLTHPATI